MTITDDGTRHQMRKPCPACGATAGIIATVHGQDTVRCAACNRFCYNAPRSETGRELRSLRTRPDIKPSQRARILMLDRCACIMCHRHDVPLDVGHVISVRDGLRLGLSMADLYCDANLAAMCDSCNSGLGSVSVPLRLMVAALRARR